VGLANCSSSIMPPGTNVSTATIALGFGVRGGDFIQVDVEIFVSLSTRRFGSDEDQLGLATKEKGCDDLIALP